MAMSQGEIYDKILSIISKQLNTPIDTINRDASLDRLGADSLDKVEIVMKLEDEFDIEVSDKDAEKLNTIDDIFQLVSKNIR